MISLRYPKLFPTMNTPSGSGFIRYHRYGKEFFRARPSHYRDKRTEQQVLQRIRLEAAVVLYRTLKTTLLPALWKEAAHSRGCSGYNLFIKRNINAFDKEGKITDHAKLSFAEGSLQLPDHLQVVPSGRRSLLVRWRDLPEQAKARANDRLCYALIRSSSPFEVIVETDTAVLRQAETTELFPPWEAGETLWLYVFFHNPGKNRFTDQRFFEIREDSL